MFTEAQVAAARDSSLTLEAGLLTNALVLESDDDLRYSREIGERYGGEEFVVITYSPKGDLLVTSGLGGRFPVGYPVAVVSAVERDPGEGSTFFGGTGRALRGPLRAGSRPLPARAAVGAPDACEEPR